MDEKEKELLEALEDNKSEEVKAEAEYNSDIDTFTEGAVQKIPEEFNSAYQGTPCADTEKKTAVIQKPVIITAICFLVTALIVIGTVLIYTALTKPKLVLKDGKDGTVYAWQLLEYNGDDYSEKHIYAQFFEDDTVNFYENGIKFFGKYTTEENDEGEKVLKSDFYIFGMSGGEGVISEDSDKDNMTITFGEITIKFEKTELPQISLDPDDITHASADEAGLTEVSVDEKILGTWKEIMDEYYIQMGYSPMKYTFNSDGTGVMGYDYTYNESYGYGYGMDFGFKYTVKDNNIFLTVKYFDGNIKDMEMQYGLNGGNLVISGVGFEKVN